MAARLSVVMVHAAPPTAAGKRVSERLVGELIGRPGMDLALVGALDDLSPDSTDRLTLESLTGDAVVMAWRPVAETMADLLAIGITGVRALHAGDPGGVSAQAGQRRIYGFDLSNFIAAEPVLQILQGMLRSSGVKTFSIGSLGTTGANHSGGGIPSDAATESAGHDSSLAASSSEKPLPRSFPAKAGGMDLDDLLDQLDESDR
ncbi:hypothetical protein [Rubripirellula reticaptiva]|uniref:Uncharacterized protein n=1 Tax=Rubripirellula reticaptiva TaxID=2528013 RepID=A0A5C6F6F8_9BACT|nr:hypothetical protein [Rubripirellula reticaptiva]TWU55081.1 hypothetical protein Poly59_13760 [Rubripirellula reticaptiva]